MNPSLSLFILIFSIVWVIGLLWCIKTEKIAVKYSVVWFLAILLVSLVVIFPDALSSISTLFGFEVMSNFIAGVLITILLVITLILTIIVTTLKTTVRLLIQEVSLLKSDLAKLTKPKK